MQIFILLTHTCARTPYDSTLFLFFFLSPRNHTTAIDLTQVAMSFITLYNRLRTRERLETSSCRMDTFAENRLEQTNERSTSIDSYCINSRDIHTQTHVYTREARSCANFPVIRSPADRPLIYNRIVSAKKTFVASLLTEFFFSSLSEKKR